MISEVMNSVLMFATFVLSDVEVEQCVYSSMDMSCSSSFVQCTPLCDRLACSTLTCSGVDDYLQQNYKADHDDCFHSTDSPYDIKVTCVNDNGGSDNGGSDSGGNDNGGNDNGGSDNGGSDNGGSDNSGSDNGDDDDVTITMSTCFSQNGLCEQCTEGEFDISTYGDFSTCEQFKTSISRAFVGFEDYGSCFTPTVGGVSGADMIFGCSGGAAGSSSSDNTGMIVGIVIGCIILVAGIVIFVFCMKKQNKL